jgi:hypothetical protein
MRITRELLLKNARDTVAKRAPKEDGLLAAYLCGSLLPGCEPLLGGAADIDLVFIYAEQTRPREIVRLTDEVHIDIQHRNRAQYEPARDLRERAWLGHEVTTCQVLYDTDHFFDFVQAGARSMFDTQEYTLIRAQPFFERARAAWFDFYNHPPEAPGPLDVAHFIGALEDLGNGLASLIGAPLPERRFLLDLPERTARLGLPHLAEAMAGLLGVGEVDAGRLSGWLGDWRAAFLAAKSPDTRLHPQRIHYYASAIEALVGEDNLAAALWPLLRTWTDAVAGLDAGSDEVAAWHAAAQRLNLIGDGAFALRVNGLDALLDRAEEFLEGWKGGLGES